MKLNNFHGALKRKKIREKGFDFIFFFPFYLEPGRNDRKTVFLFHFLILNLPYDFLKKRLRCVHFIRSFGELGKKTTNETLSFFRGKVKMTVPLKKKCNFALDGRQE